MFEIIDQLILPHIKGLWTLPWILIGFLLTIFLAKLIGRENIDKLMKKIGLMILYFFVPVLIFRIFFNTSFGINEITFSIVVTIIIAIMYFIALLYAKYVIKKQKIPDGKKNLFLKTMLTNQGRSSAFIGSMMLGIATLKVYAAIFMALVGIALFAIIPFILSHMHKKETKNKKEENKNPLPWFLRLYPWYLIIFVVAGILFQYLLGPVPESVKMALSEYILGANIDTIWALYTAITIPAALYYVGAGIHPSDFKKSELKKLIGLNKKEEKSDHWAWVRKTFLLTVIITPVILSLVFGSLFAIGLIPLAWLAVILINVFLPITSTNMFLLPYGIDKKTTAHAVTWTTLVCVPIVVALITVFDLML